MNTKYIFKNGSTKNDLTYNPKPAKHKFYQICLYKNPENNKYHIRRCIINENCEFLNIDVKYISEKHFNKFISNHKQYEYKFYPTYNLDLVDIPNPGNIMQAISPLLNNDNDFISGFEQFN